MMKAKKKLVWLLVIVAVVAAMGLVSTAGWAQTGEGSDTRPPGNDTAAPVAEAPQSSNDVPRTAPSAEQGKEQADTTATAYAFTVRPPAAFTSDGNIPDGFMMSFAGGYFFGTVEVGACLLAPVQLPKGVTITSFEVRLDDGNATLSEWFDLHRINLETGAATMMATVSSPAGTTGGLVALTDNTISDPDVSDMYAYQVTTCARPNINVYSVRIGYGSTTSLPSVLKNHQP